MREGRGDRGGKESGGKEDRQVEGRGEGVRDGGGRSLTRMERGVDKMEVAEKGKGTGNLHFPFADCTCFQRRVEVVE